MLFRSKEPFKVHLVYPSVILIIIPFVTATCNQHQDLLIWRQYQPVQTKNFIYSHAALQSQAAKRSIQVIHF